ncbi:MAG: cupin domain-containing protein [Demequina sp.]|uniref:cupin domain-containing protein n=1 Tax=Demequina sp. TaxID=2050685 RepID=UPI00199A7FC8|nr:cupin domain-containing protein [Demequina sp.]MBC7297826.1 cupin domain-containing protein [Demequina sp.]
MEPLDLTALAAEHLAEARAASNGRSSVKLVGDHSALLRENLIALKAGAALQDHESPGEATLLVLEGQIEFHAGDETVMLDAGHLIEIPPTRHGLTALTDAVVILAVAKA